MEAPCGVVIFKETLFWRRHLFRKVDGNTDVVFDPWNGRYLFVRTGGVERIRGRVGKAGFRNLDDVICAFDVYGIRIVMVDGNGKNADRLVGIFGIVRIEVDEGIVVKGRWFVFWVSWIEE